ncbi:extracellular solute-binding protein [Bacillus sp. EB106-08-02-XG196]|uniref:ABC transporter substrate-binding protein n=1 Tax=Bacillus sp. EB106-08-02-XG196 TaxID=2737049 RepID=UPI0015C4CD25|nr:extracellular solute-binding protein [Bacillus sp. EB106-08-02-XG196]NWQ40558.1 extracellular solute-binding protein [Bacillus sp. EB106-08-02-XG196]
MKTKIVIALILVLSTFLVACSGGSNKSSSSEKEKIEIRLLTRMAGTTKQVEIYKDILKEFEKKHKDVKIIDESQGDESAFNNKLKTDIASGTLPNIFRIQGVANLGEYIDNGLLMNMDPILKDDPAWGDGFTEGALKYYQVQGHEGTYGIPMESGLIGVYYNEELFKEAGIDQFPETWNQLIDAIKKLEKIKVTPIALGAKSTYMAGHLHDQIFYKWAGTEAAKKLGSRELKWTDKEVVETLKYVKDLNDMGAFGKDAAGLNDELVLTNFLEGKAGMIITGPWNIGSFTDESKTKFTKAIKVAKFPYFEEKPEFKNEDMQVLSPYMVNGKLEGKEKEYTIELLKMLTSADAAKRFAEESQFLIPRNDIEIDQSKVADIFLQNIELGSTSTGIAVDIFDFDPLPSMQDRTRNSIVSMFINATPKEAAKEIQEEIDKSK